MGRKEEFKEWLKTQKKPNREPYAENTRKHYASTIGEVSKWGNENNIFDQDLYSIDDSDEWDKICKSLDSSPKYVKVKENRHWGASFTHEYYRQFVASISLKSDNRDANVTRTDIVSKENTLFE